MFGARYDGAQGIAHSVKADHTEIPPYALCPMRHAFSFRIPHSDFRIPLFLVFIDVNIALRKRDTDPFGIHLFFYLFSGVKIK